MAEIIYVQNAHLIKVVLTRAGNVRTICQVNGVNAAMTLKTDDSSIYRFARPSLLILLVCTIGRVAPALIIALYRE